MNILTLYYICYIILAMYMLGSDQGPSYNLSKSLLLLPRILKLIEDMVNDSTPLLMVRTQKYFLGSIKKNSNKKKILNNKLKTRLDFPELPFYKYYQLNNVFMQVFFSCINIYVFETRKARKKNFASKGKILRKISKLHLFSSKFLAIN